MPAIVRGMSSPLPTFEETVTPTSRLVTSELPPNLDDLDAGDMIICGSDWGIDQYVDEAHARGIHVRHGDYRYQIERVVPKTAKRRVLIRGHTPLSGHDGETPAHSEKASLEQATDAFAATWDALSTSLDHNPHFEDAATYLPDHYLPYLPFPTLNPAQVQTAPHVTDTDTSLVITAPTGAGKTVIGMMAVLKGILDKGKKAAWLVPQRSLTAELDQELDTWRGQGLKVVALSGETATDTRATQDADLWVATTEKFEALCRSSSMRETIEQIDTIVVDEIHLLGDPSRGATLESLLARVNAEQLPVRIVGLSATAANAPAVAHWLGADLIPITWRPTRQTQQMLMVPADTTSGDSRNRNAVCAALATDVALDGGSTIIFCGTKAKVRSTALAIARSRGADTTNIDASDPAAVYDATHQTGVGLHYSDWPHKKEAEQAFRNHDSNVLVATSTLAAGVNLPARVVIVRDTTIGQNAMEVSMVQQMFGRAGRAGKEPEGWAFLIADTYEIGQWRQKLADGYAIRSALTHNLADHLLGEVVQGNITTSADATQWFSHTFARHEGENGAADLTKARTTLDTFGFINLDTDTNPANPTISATRLGQITSRMMVSVADARGIIAALNGKNAPATPTNANTAEELLASIVATNTTALANANTATGNQAPAVRRILDAHGDINHLGTPRSAPGRGGKDTLRGDQVSTAALLLTLRSPKALNTRGGQILGINRALLNPALYDSPRIFAWLAAIGPLGTIPAWASALAVDIGPRITWHNTLPRRGDGRVLAACERATGRSKASRLVPALFQACREAGVITPDQLDRTVPVGGVSQTQIQKASQRTVKVDGGCFAAGVTAFVSLGNGKWAAMQPGEALRDRLAVAFHSSGDATGTGWIGSLAA